MVMLPVARSKLRQRKSHSAFCPHLLMRDWPLETTKVVINFFLSSRGWGKDF